MYNWMEVKIKYQKIDEATGKDKTVNESYLIDAVSFTEAEARAYQILEEELGCEFIIKNINPVNITDVFFNDGDIWFKCSVVYIDVDPATGKDKKTKVYNLICAENLKDAEEKLAKELSEVLIPWECKTIAETNIIDVFPYNTEEAENEGLAPISEIPAIYCIEIDRSGLPEEDMVLHHSFNKEPTREEILKIIEDEDCGYDDNYCKFEYYKVE